MRALITGITGQDGSYLCEFLLSKGYEVFGLIRRLSTPNTERIAHMLGQITLIPGDLLDQSSLMEALRIAEPDEVYNLASQSHVGRSFTEPVSTAEYTGVGVVRLLEAIRLYGKGIRFYQASSSEMFGKAQQTPQNERTPFYPRSPYGSAKLYGHWATINYRESYLMYACNGILFNHESPRRGPDFVTRKITQAIARIVFGSSEKLKLGNLDAKRDWGYAGDYTEAMWMMLQQPKPDDYVIATGRTHSVQDFVEAAFAHVGIRDWERYVETDPELYRHAEVDALIGDFSKAKRVLGWEPRITFEQLVGMMVESDQRVLSEVQQWRS